MSALGNQIHPTFTSRRKKAVWSRTAISSLWAAFLVLCAALVNAEKIPDSVDLITRHDPAPTKAALAFRDVSKLNDFVLGGGETTLTVTQKNLRDRFPFIIGLFSASGGRFLLYRPGQPPLEAPPVPPIYQLAKAVAHAALGAYEIVAPALPNTDTDQSWLVPMQGFQAQLLVASAALPDLDIEPGQRELLQATLDKVRKFVDACVARKACTYDEVVAYARAVEPETERLIALAADVQVAHWFDVLTDWKKQLGSDWDNTYAAINTLFATRQNNILYTITVQFMGEEAINRRLFLFETTNFKITPDEMYGIFTHYMHDRALSKVFFNDEDLMSHELLGGAVRRAVEAEAKQRGQKAILPSQAPLNSNQWPWLTEPEKGSGARSLEDLHDMGILPPLSK